METTQKPRHSLKQALAFRSPKLFHPMAYGLSALPQQLLLRECIAVAASSLAPTGSLNV